MDKIIELSLSEISAFFAHPFVLLIAGALISSILVTVLTQRWQDRKTKFELKVFIANEISETAVLMLATTMTRSKGEKNMEKEEITVTKAMKLEVNMRAYFPRDDFVDEWAEYVSNFVTLWDTIVKMDVKHDYFIKDIEKLKNYFDKKFPNANIDWNKILNDQDVKEFFSVRTAMFKHSKYFVRKVLDAEIVLSNKS